MKAFNIAVVAGDGIGKEVVPEGIRVLEAAGRRFGFQISWHTFDWSCESYFKTGRMMPAGWPSKRTGSCFALGTLNTYSPWLPAVCQFAACTAVQRDSGTIESSHAGHRGHFDDQGPWGGYRATSEQVGMGILENRLLAADIERENRQPGDLWRGMSHEKKPL
jgi:hypothetical protein